MERVDRPGPASCSGTPGPTFAAHSGGPGQFGSFLALLQPRDTILGMVVARGHLTHGSPVECVSKVVQRFHYGVSLLHRALDFDVIRQLG